MSALFKSSIQAKHYAQCRPNYPKALYDKISSEVRCPRGVAMDVGCGTGQATIPLTEYFSRVIAVDPSEAQLDQATKHERVTYRIGVETDLPAEDGSISIVTAAQAAHWFDMEKFYHEADRVLQPGGVIALWSYGIIEFPKVEGRGEDFSCELHRRVVDDFYLGLLKQGGYWDERRQLVDERYQNMPLLPSSRYHTERITCGYDLRQRLTVDELVGYLRSWSGYATYCERNSTPSAYSNDDDPVESIRKFLNSRIDKDGIHVMWPVTLLLSVKREET